MKNYTFQNRIFSTVAVFLLLFTVACQKEYLETPDAQDDVLTVTSSETDVILTEMFSQNLLTFNWTTGTNQGTNSAISYTLFISEDGDGNSIPLEYNLGKNVFSFSYEWGTLNEILLNTFGAEAGTPMVLKAKVIASASADGVAQQEASATCKVTPYNPVSTTLFIIGSATPAGLDIANAPELVPSDSEPGVFTYQGQLSPGTFKFAVNRDTCWCQDFYTRDPSDTAKMVYNQDGSGDDLQWEITEAGEYTIIADLLKLTISKQYTLTPPFSEIWIVGDASPSGWNIDSPEAFTQSEEDPFIFTYEANLTPGEFKIFAGPLGDWCGEWYRPPLNGQDLTSNEVEQNSGCDVDNKWLVTDESKGRYKIILNTLENSIQFQLVSLYLIGDGGPNGWNIATPEPMTYEDGTFIFIGELGADNPTGEFKISKFKGDWCDGDWINSANPSQSLLNTDYITTHGCDGPDNKWKLGDGDAGTWEIRINLDEGVMTITR